jgi:hypothetical protein
LAGLSSPSAPPRRCQATPSHWDQPARTHVVEGLEQAPAALNMLFDGTNRGKLIVRL